MTGVRVEAAPVEVFEDDYLNTARIIVVQVAALDVQCVYWHSRGLRTPTIF